MDLQIKNVVYAPIITIVIQGLKNIGLPNAFSPIVSWILGVIISVGFTSGNYFLDVLNGILLGATATGIYEGTKFGGENIKKLL